MSVTPGKPEFIRQVESRYGGLVARFLARRIESDEAFQRFIQEDFDGHYWPLMSGHSLAAALSDTLAADIRQDRKILFVVDYDADGINAGAVFVKMMTFLNRREGEHWRIITGHRKWGYGLTESLIDDNRDLFEWADVIVTADLGSNDTQSGERLRQMGKRVYVTDHHIVSDPSLSSESFDILFNPSVCAEHDWQTKICGAGVAMWVALMVLERLGLDPMRHAPVLKTYAGIATVTDVMPMDMGLNRHLVKHALSMFNSMHDGRIPFIAVSNSDGKRIDETFFGFTLGPALNALSRMHQSPMDGVRFLTTRDMAEAVRIWQTLVRNNEDRKAVSNHLSSLALDHVDEHPERNAYSFIIRTEMMHGINSELAELSGINGLIAGKMTQYAMRPAFCFNHMNNGEFLSGSGRSPGSDLMEIFGWILERYPHLELSFGGHRVACGLRIKASMYPVFEKALSEVPDEMIHHKSDKAYDIIVGQDDVTDEQLMVMEGMRPFGNGFEPISVYAQGRIRTVNSPSVKVSRYEIDGGDREFVEFYPRKPRHADEEVFIIGGVSYNDWSGKYQYLVRTINNLERIVS